MGDILGLSLLAMEIMQLRIRKGLGINELAKKSGVQASSISKMESGHQNSMHPKTLKKLAKALGVSYKYLMQLREQDRKETDGISNNGDPVMAAFIADKSIPVVCSLGLSSALRLREREQPTRIGGFLISKATT